MKRFVFLALILVLPMSQKADENVTQKIIKPNGISWFWFGQAVVDSAQSAVCFFEDEERDEEQQIIVMNREDLSRIKAFVRGTFFEKFDFSPIFPEYLSLRYRNVIRLYSVRRQPNDESPDYYDKVLVHIPISEQTTGEQYDDIVKEYHDLIKSIKKTPKKRTWWQIFFFTSCLFTSSMIFFYVRRKRKHENI